MHSFVLLLDTILELYSYVIIMSVIASWLISFRIVDPSSRIVQRILHILHILTDKIYSIIRKAIPVIGGLDFSPIIVLLSIYFLRKLLIEYFIY